ncbi:MAG: hypothetical protein O3A10_16970, partial [Chloroflexi bacterium]|nr:hypothetical protein [Chloroflexota bacterium]
SRPARASTFAVARSAPPRWAWLAGGAAALVALILVGWLVLPGFFQQDSANRLEQALAAARTQVTAAAASTSPDVRRNALDAALVELERARAVDPEDPRLVALNQEISDQLALLNAVVNADTRSILTFAGTVTTPLDPLSITVGGGFLWMIDREQGRVLRVDPEAAFEPIEVFVAGALYRGVVAAAAEQATWDQGGTRLLILDADRQLWSLTLGAESVPAPLPLRDATELASVADIASYVTNLYILDPAGGEVWRYLPAGDGFDSERAGLLGSIDIPEATHLAVDGDLYVQDGSVLRRFRQGTEQGSLLVGIDQPPASPAAVVEDLIRGLFFVADRGNGRIVVGDRDGLFIRQYRNPGFADLRGLALSGDGGTLYVLTGDGIDAFSVIEPDS